MPTPSTFAKKLASVAQEQHAKFQFANEADTALCTQIKKWTQDIGFQFTSCTQVPWSAVFVSWCVKHAGATSSEFDFAMAHSVFVKTAIDNAVIGSGVFQGFDIANSTPAVGDIIQHNRGNGNFDFIFASTHAHYQSHSVIVIEVGQDSRGRFAFCVGGNESDSIRRTVVRLDQQGFVKQRAGNSFISIIKNLK